MMVPAGTSGEAAGDADRPGGVDPAPPLRGDTVVTGLEAPPAVVIVAGRGLALAVFSIEAWRTDSEISRVIFFSCHSITTFAAPIETNL
jgi:hypothetical protein